MMKTSTFFLAGVLLGCGGVAKAAPAPAKWEQADCSALGLKFDETESGMACGWVDVPESRTRESSRRVRVAVLVAKALGKREADPIIYLHGGPGIAALEIAPRVFMGKYWPVLRRNRDIIFIDQRGTGKSTPRICPDLDDDMQKLGDQALSERVELERTVQLVRTCRKALDQSGLDLGAFNAIAIADDMENIRQALGYGSWNVFATSYGTLPGLETARRYPATLRSILIDSAFPSHSQYWAEQISITAEALSAVQRRCDADPACKARYPDIRSLAATAIRSLNASPVQAGDIKVDGSKFLGALWTTLVQTPTAEFVPELVKRAAARDEAVIATVGGVFGAPGTFGSYSPFQSLVVNCHEILTPSSKLLVARAIRNYPDLAGDLIADGQDRLCSEIQPTRASIDFFRPVESAIPAVIFAGEFDPATPAIDAYETARFLKNATVIEVEGASHAPFYSDECTRSIGVAFFNNPQAVLDTSCLKQRPARKFAGPAKFDEFVKGLKK